MMCLLIITQTVSDLILYYNGHWYALLYARVYCIISGLVYYITDNCTNSKLFVTSPSIINMCVYFRIFIFG